MSWPIHSLLFPQRIARLQSCRVTQCGDIKVSLSCPPKEKSNLQLLLAECVALKRNHTARGHSQTVNNIIRYYVCVTQLTNKDIYLGLEV